VTGGVDVSGNDAYISSISNAPENSMTSDKANAIIATSYNLHVGPKERGEAMTPDKAVKLPQNERAALCKLLSEKGGSDLYTKAQAAEAYRAVVEGRA
jgi:hypothetical protein